MSNSVNTVLQLIRSCHVRVENNLLQYYIVITHLVGSLQTSNCMCQVLPCMLAKSPILLQVMPATVNGSGIQFRHKHCRFCFGCNVYFFASVRMCIFVCTFCVLAEIYNTRYFSQIRRVLMLDNTGSRQQNSATLVLDTLLDLYLDGFCTIKLLL